MDQAFEIAGKKFGSRLMVGTGRHRNMEEMVASIEASGAEIITANTPGVTSADMSSFSYEHRRAPLYPFEPDTTF